MKTEDLTNLVHKGLIDITADYFRALGDKCWISNAILDAFSKKMLQSVEIISNQRFLFLSS